MSRETDWYSRHDATFSRHDATFSRRYATLLRHDATLLRRDATVLSPFVTRRKSDLRQIAFYFLTIGVRVGVLNLPRS